MDNPAIVRKTIRFQRAAIANTLALVSTIQQRGGELLKTTLEQTSWLPGSSRKACLYWNQAWTAHLCNMTGTIDSGFAEMERLLSPLESPGKKPAANAAAAGSSRTPRPVAGPATPRSKTGRGGAKGTAPTKPVAGKKTAPAPPRRPAKPANDTVPVAAKPFPPTEARDIDNLSAAGKALQATATPLNSPGQRLPANDPTITETTTSIQEIKTDVGN